MKKLVRAELAVMAGALLYGYLFWHEGWGVNTIIGTGFLLGITAWLRPDSFRSTPVKWLAVGLGFSAVMVVLNNSIVSKLLHFSSMILLIGFVQGRFLRFAGYALLLGAYSLLQAPLGIVLNFTIPGSRHLKPGWWRHSIWQVLLPGALGLFFFIIYFVANEAFAQMVEDALQRLAVIFPNHLPIGLVFLGFWGASMVFALLYPNRKAQSFEAHDEAQTFDLHRKHKASKSSNPIALKYHYKTALITVILLNLLLAMVNLADIGSVWTGFQYESPYALSRFVHTGTYWLIFSIFLSGCVVLYFFRGNLNFLKNNRSLRTLTQVWLLQNALLALSVGMRNYHYIAGYGLAYKRIGVLIFLLLTIIGLYTLYTKVAQQRSFFYLAHTNAWAWYGIWLLCSTVNWDECITRYNLSRRPDSIDMQFLIHSVSDKNTYLLLQNRERLHNTGVLLYDENHMDGLEIKPIICMNKISSHSWLSWNLPDEINKRAIMRRY